MERRQGGTKGSAGTLVIAAGGVVWTCKSHMPRILIDTSDKRLLAGTVILDCDGN